MEEVRKIYTLAYQMKCKGITIYRYGSKEGQVLSLGERKKDMPGEPITVESDYAGGCALDICSV